MTVLTFNDAHFKPMGVTVINPRVGLPSDAPPRA
jgi:hypothetical protein